MRVTGPSGTTIPQGPRHLPAVVFLFRQNQPHEASRVKFCADGIPAGLSLLKKSGRHRHGRIGRADVPVQVSGWVTFC